MRKAGVKVLGEVFSSYGARKVGVLLFWGLYHIKPSVLSSHSKERTVNKERGRCGRSVSEWEHVDCGVGMYPFREIVS